MKHYNFLVAVLALCVMILPSCCGQRSVNPYDGVLTSFDENGIKSCSEYFSMEEPTEIHIYTETSGSMNYLYRPGCATDFKYNFSSLILNLSNKLHDIKVFDGHNRIYRLAASDFITQMKKGSLPKTNSTPIPQILDSILHKSSIDTGAVSILISDMKYAPAVSKKDIDVWKSVYALEVASKFRAHQELSVSFIGMESNAFSSSKALVSDSFPYYMLIVGDAEKVAWLKDQISHMSLKGVSGISDFNIDYNCPDYTILPSSVIGLADNYFDTKNSPRKYSLINYVDEMFSEFVIGIDSRHLAGQAELSKVTSTWPQTKVTMSVLPAFKLTDSDKAACEGMIPDTFLKINIQEIDQDCETLSLIYESSKENSLKWITKYYGGMKESDFPQTVSIEGFVEGLIKAYQTHNIQNHPMEVLISKF